MIIGRQNQSHPIDIRKISGMSCISTLNFEIGNFKTFLQLGGDYVFGCDHGVAITNSRYFLLNKFPSKEYIYGISKYNEDIIVTAKHFGNVQLINIRDMNEMKHAQHKQLKTTLIYDIYKTHREGEFCLTTEY